MKAFAQIIEDLPNELSKLKSKLNSILCYIEDPSDCLFQLQELLSSSIPELSGISSSVFSKSIYFLTNHETDIVYFQFFMILSKSLNSNDLSQIVKKNEIFEKIVREFVLNINTKGSNYSLLSLFFRLDYSTFVRSYLEFLEFLNFRTDLELDFYSEKKLIFQIYSNSDDLILQSLFFNSYNKGLKFMRICNSYYRSMKICSEIIHESSEKLSPKFFKFFKFLMLKSNKNNSISVKNKRFHCVVSSDIEGFEDLVYLFYNSNKSLYKKCRNLISSLLTCFTQTFLPKIKIILKDLISILINSCNDSKKMHQIRLIKLIYSMILENDLKKSKKFTEVLVNYENNLDTLKTNKVIQVKHARKLLAEKFNLDSDCLSFEIENKVYGPQKNSKILKLTQELCLNVKIESNILEINFILLSNTLKEFNEFFWNLTVKAEGEKYIEKCMFISEITINKELINLITNFEFEIEFFNGKPIPIQMVLVNVISLVSFNEEWVMFTKSLNLHNKIFKFLIQFVERKLNFTLFWKVIKIISYFGRIQSYNKNVIFQLAQALAYWIIDNPKEELKSSNTESLTKAFKFFTDQLSSSHKSNLIKELITQNIDNFADYILAVSIQSLNFIYSQNLEDYEVPKKTIKNILKKLDEKIENLTEINPVNLVCKISFLSHFNYSPKVIIAKLLKHLFKNTIDSKDIKLVIKTLKKNPEFSLSLDEFENFIFTFLIPKLDNLNQDYPLFKTRELRNLGYEFVHSQCALEENKSLSLLNILNSLLSNKSWRKKNIKYWSLKLSPIEVSAAYKGLKNPGSICYSNCFIQQLYQISSFREPILRLNTNEKNCLSALQKVFVKLKFSNKSSVSSKDLIKQCLGSKGLTEQMDTDEYFLILLEKCSKSDVGSKFEEIIQLNFVGTQNLEIKCSECNMIYNKKQNFKSIGLEIIKNSQNSLINSLRIFTKGETLSGDNALFCEGCKRKVVSRVKINFIRLPEYLIFNLKRFEYDSSKMVKSKINEKFEFTEEINLTQFTDHKSVSNIENCKFQLKGVINHIGTADHGHYISYIKVDNGDWVEFNDSRVSKISLAKLFKRSFGMSHGGNNTSSAYILIYEKIENLNKPSLDLNSQNLSSNELKYLPSISEKNRIIKSTEILFTEDFLDCFISLLNYKEFHIINIHYLLSCFIRIDITASEKMEYYRLMLKKLNINSIKYLIEILSSPAGIDEFILCNPHSEHKTFILILIEKNIPKLKKSFISLTYKRLLKIFDNFGVTVHNCNVYLNQLFFIIVNNLEESMKFEYIKTVHFKFLNKEYMENKNHDVEDFECDFLWSDVKMEFDQDGGFDKRCPFLFFRFLAENFEELSSSQIKSLKNYTFIKTAFYLTETKICNFTISLLFSKIYENNISGALKYLKILLELCENYNRYDKLKLVPIFFNVYSNPAELFIHFINTYFIWVYCGHEMILEECILNLIKCLKKFKFSDIEEVLDDELKARLRENIEAFLCDKESIEITIVDNFFLGNSEEVYDENDEIGKNCLKKGKTVTLMYEDTVDFLVEDNFCGKILRLEGNKRSMLLDFVHFSKIVYGH